MNRMLVICPVVVVLAFLAVASTRTPKREGSGERRAEASVLATRARETVPKATLVCATNSTGLPERSASAGAPSGPAAPTEAGTPSSTTRCEAMPGCGNTPEGVFERAKLGLLTHDIAVVRDATTGLSESQLQELMQATPLLATKLAGCEVKGDEAILHIELPIDPRIPDKTRDVKAVREAGKWRLALGQVWAEEECHECMNNLRQIGTYIVMWCGKFGDDVRYPGPGMKLITDLFNYPSAQNALCAYPQLLLCKTSGETNTPESIARGDADCTSYEVTTDALADGRTLPQTPILWDKRPVHGGKRNVLLFCGAVQTMTEAEFQAARQVHR